MKKQRILCLCMTLLLALSLSACKGQMDEENSSPITDSVQSTITPTEEVPPAPSIPFTDVPENSFYYDAVVWAYGNGIASDGDTFAPLSTCTRGQVITFLWRAMGSPEPQIDENLISDISPSDWFYKPVLWAYESGISTSSTFKPSNPCTNGEALTFLWRAKGKPMAAVNSSAVALAASGAYYERPAAWADSNGLFAQIGAAFDAAAPCSRAYLMSYLYWAEEQWTGAEENRALQAEYEQIINDAQLYEVHGSGLCYADFIDVDNDGNVELLTLDISKSESDYDDSYDMGKVTAIIYANIGGHVGKSYEVELLFGADLNYFMSYSICTAEDNLYLCCCNFSSSGASYCFYKIENGDFVRKDDIYTWRDGWDAASNGPTYLYSNFGQEITEAEYDVILQKYTVEKELFSTAVGYATVNASVQEWGLLPAQEEYWARTVFKVNGTTVELSADPYTKGDGTIMVPLWDVLETMGVAVYANSDASVILASTKSDTLAITYKDFSDRKN